MTKTKIVGILTLLFVLFTSCTSSKEKVDGKEGISAEQASVTAISSEKEKTVLTQEQLLTQKVSASYKAMLAHADIKLRSAPASEPTTMAEPISVAERIPFAPRPTWLDTLQDDEYWIYAVGVSDKVSSEFRSLSRAQQQAASNLVEHSASYSLDGSKSRCHGWELVSIYTEKLIMSDGGSCYVTAVLVRYPKRLVAGQGS